MSSFIFFPFFLSSPAIISALWLPDCWINLRPGSGSQRRYERHRLARSNTTLGFSGRRPPPGELKRESAGLEAVSLKAVDLVAALPRRPAAYKDESGGGAASVSAMPLTFLSCMQNSRLYLPAWASDCVCPCIHPPVNMQQTTITAPPPLRLGLPFPHY